MRDYSTEGRSNQLMEINTFLSTTNGGNAAVVLTNTDPLSVSSETNTESSTSFRSKNTISISYT